MLGTVMHLRNCIVCLRLAAGKLWVFLDSLRRTTLHILRNQVK